MLIPLEVTGNLETAGALLEKWGVRWQPAKNYRWKGHVFVKARDQDLALEALADMGCENEWD